MGELVDLAKFRLARTLVAKLNSFRLDLPDPTALGWIPIKRDGFVNAYTHMRYRALAGTLPSGEAYLDYQNTCMAFTHLSVEEVVAHIEAGTLPDPDFLITSTG